MAGSAQGAVGESILLARVGVGSLLSSTAAGTDPIMLECSTYLYCFCGQVWEHMEAVGIRRDRNIYSMLIRVCEKGGEWQKAREFKQRMANEGCLFSPK